MTSWKPEVSSPEACAEMLRRNDVPDVQGPDSSMSSTLGLAWRRLDDDEKKVLMNGLVLALEDSRSYVRTELLRFSTVYGSSAYCESFKQFFHAWPAWADGDDYFLERSLGHGTKLGSYLVRTLIRVYPAIDAPTFPALLQLARRYQVESAVVRQYLAHNRLDLLLEYARDIVSMGRSFEAQASSCGADFGQAATVSELGRRNLAEVLLLVRRMPEGDRLRFMLGLESALKDHPDILEACRTGYGSDDQAR
jgi:hypothetical protein